MQVDGRIDEESSSFEIFLSELESNSIKLCNCELFKIYILECLFYYFVMIVNNNSNNMQTRKFRRGKKIVAMFDMYLCVTLVEGAESRLLSPGTKDQGKKLSVEYSALEHSFPFISEIDYNEKIKNITVFHIPQYEFYNYVEN